MSATTGPVEFYVKLVLVMAGQACLAGSGWVALIVGRGERNFEQVGSVDIAGLLFSAIGAAALGGYAYLSKAANNRGGGEDVEPEELAAPQTVATTTTEVAVVPGPTTSAPITPKKTSVPAVPSGPARNP